MKKRLTLILATLFLCMGMAMAQTTSNGMVIFEDDNLPVVGATVKVVGTTTGTVTDANGSFTISVPSKSSQLEISYIGMSTQVVVAKKDMKIILTTADKALDEVVVTGYGVTRKKAFTGAASSIGEAQIGNKIDVNPIKALEGTVPGLQMNIGSGQPGAPATIFIRGRNSLNSGTQPLYVIDGVAFDNDAVGIRWDEGQETSPLSTLNAADIESMTVLKDATATSIYGARAANGVIVITTKHGKAGKLKVNFSAKAGWNEMPSFTDRYKIVNADKSIELAAEALLNSYNKYGDDSIFGSFNSAYGLGLNADTEGAVDFLDWYTGWVYPYMESGKSTDWLKEISRKGMIQTYNVDISGGGNTSNSPVYYASLAYDDNKSMLQGKDLTRYSFRFNMDHQASKVFKWGFNTNMSYTQTNMGSGGGYFSDPMTQVYMMSPLTGVYDEEGNFNFDTSTGYNPVAMRSKYGDKSLAKQYRLTLSPYVLFNITPNFFFKSQAGLDAYMIDEFGYWSFLQPQGEEMNGMGENANTTRMLLTMTNTLNYVKTFAGSHNVNLLLGQEGQKKLYKNAYLAASNYPVEDLNDVSLAATPSSAYTVQQQLLLSSWFANAQYDYQNKYYASASLRADGSSRFAQGHRWATFWSLGAKYRISEEEFFAPVKNIINNASIRASYGTAGNQEVGTGYYAAKYLYGYGYNYNGQPGMALEQFANENLQWETTKKFNVGVDLSFIDRINLSLDYYNHQTTDMVFEVPLSFATGMSSIYQNIGQLENKGLEASIDASIIKTKNIEWNLGFSASRNWNKIKKLSTDYPIEGTYQITEVGKPIYQFFMKEYAGVDPETGDALWYRYGSNDEIPAGADANETTNNYNKAGKRYLGSSNPKWQGGINTSLAAYGFDLNLQMNYSLGGKIYGNNLRYDAQLGESFYEAFINYVYDNRWQKPGDITNVPALQTNGSYANKASSRFLMSGNYFKIRSLSLGYSLPKSIVSKAYLNKVRVFMEAENLYTFTASDYIGFDPAGIEANGVQWWNYPQSRSFVFGVQVGF